MGAGFIILLGVLGLAGQQALLIARQDATAALPAGFRGHRRPAIPIRLIATRRFSCSNYRPSLAIPYCSGLLLKIRSVAGYPHGLTRNPHRSGRVKGPPSMDLQQGVPIMGPGGYDVRLSY